jgi:hydroxymethylbilane synthase
MAMSSRPIIIATRGSALALAQANFVLTECQRKFPQSAFELKIIKTTGDKLQTASMSRIDANLTRGLFTKELEVALLQNEADLAVHSLKDLPTELPDGLKLGAVAGQRADVRDVFIYRETIPPKTRMADFPRGLTLATSSTRRKAQVLAQRPDFKVIEIRGNVATRLEKLAASSTFDATILAAAGLDRLHFQVTDSGHLQGDGIPAGLRATILELEEMLPCVGQGALGLEIREHDDRIAEICEGLTDSDTFHCVTAERALLRALGGGCQTPIGAYAAIVDREISLRAISFLTAIPRRAETRGHLAEAVELGQRLAARLQSVP